MSCGEFPFHSFDNSPPPPLKYQRLVLVKTLCLDADRIKKTNKEHYEKHCLTKGSPSRRPGIYLSKISWGFTLGNGVSLANGRVHEVFAEIYGILPHDIYLSRQAIDILVALHTCSHGSAFVFPKRNDLSAPVSTGTFNRFLAFGRTPETSAGAMTSGLVAIAPGTLAATVVKLMIERRITRVVINEDDLSTGDCLSP